MREAALTLARGRDDFAPSLAARAIAALRELPDLMRRRKNAENGTMEFLFISLFEWARAQGSQGFNLGLSSLSGVGEQPQDPAAERLMHFVYEHINQFYNFKGLHSFKEKFHPRWSPRYLIYPSASNLPQAWLAVVEANSGTANLFSGYLTKRLAKGMLIVSR